MSTHVKPYPVQKSDEEWRRTLTPEQYSVLRQHGTERPGTCALLYEKRGGTFSCAGCGQPLFVAERKFESGTGWPSFFEPLDGALGTSATSSRTARRRRACATASTASPCTSRRTRSSREGLLADALNGSPHRVASTHASLYATYDERTIAERRDAYCGEIVARSLAPWLPRG
jgi:peptide methionine sulfoxide reductase MsrB